MLAYVELELDQMLDYRKASSLQGILFEQIDPDYASYLHQNMWHPYSQYIVLNGENCVWRIMAFDQEAYHHIIEKVMAVSFNQFQLKKSALSVNIIGKQLHVYQKSTLIDEFNNVPGERYINIKVLTPMAFKQKGRYVIFPDCRLMYQSLMNKYSNVSKNLEMFDEETLELLVENSEIIRYKTRSMQFPLEGISVPGYVGEFTIKFYGSELLARYIRLLFKFGEFSGVGVKTAMGMGAIKIQGGNAWHERSGKEADYR